MSVWANWSSMMLSGESGLKFTQKASLGRARPMKKYLSRSLEVFSNSLVEGLRFPFLEADGNYFGSGRIAGSAGAEGGTCLWPAPYAKRLNVRQYPIELQPGQSRFARNIAKSR